MMRIILFLGLLCFGQAEAQVMSKMLWKSVDQCYQEAKQGAIDAEAPEEVANVAQYDAKNGYLTVSGSWPTCGCGCEATAAAFKDSKGKYTIMKYEYWDCTANRFGLFSSEKLKDVMPKGFGYTSFTTDNKTVETKGNSFFYLYADIPQKGTDLKIELKQFPVGLYAKSEDILAYNTNNAKGLYQETYILENIIERINKDEELNLILKGDFEELSAPLLAVIQKNIGPKEAFKTKNELIKAFELLQDYYRTYNQLKYTKMTLGWNRKAARFYIKSRDTSPEKKTFLVYLKSTPFFNPGC
ncbi:MAG: hypothetical protein GY810_29505 [Aureispira sp.]|nr:hypothetical protein [Aureispira sp.]